MPGALEDESAAFLNWVMDLSLSDKDGRALEARTEGWIAGVQMAALSTQGQEDMSGFITAFTGSHRSIIGELKCIRKYGRMEVACTRHTQEMNRGIKVLL